MKDVLDHFNEKTTPQLYKGRAYGLYLLFNIIIVAIAGWIGLFQLRNINLSIYYPPYSYILPSVIILSTVIMTAYVLKYPLLITLIFSAAMTALVYCVSYLLMLSFYFFVRAEEDTLFFLVWCISCNLLYIAMVEMAHRSGIKIVRSDKK